MGRAGRRLPALAAVFYGALAALVLLGVRDVLFLYEENRCSMTYMYEYPEYLVSAAAERCRGSGRRCNRWEPAGPGEPPLGGVRRPRAGLAPPGGRWGVAARIAAAGGRSSEAQPSRWLPSSSLREGEEEQQPRTPSAAGEPPRRRLLAAPVTLGLADLPLPEAASAERQAGRGAKPAWASWRGRCVRLNALLPLHRVMVHLGWLRRGRVAYL